MFDSLSTAFIYIPFFIALWFTLLIGWVVNIYWLFAVASDTNVEFWIALVGTIVAPLGALHGWFTLF